jgi:hypothetical protein
LVHELSAVRAAKFATVLYAADYMVRKMDVKSDSFAVIHGHRDRHHPVCWPNPTWGFHGDLRDRHGYSV